MIHLQGASPALMSENGYQDFPLTTEIVALYSIKHPRASKLKTIGNERSCFWLPPRLLWNNPIGLRSPLRHKALSKCRGKKEVGTGSSQEAWRSDEYPSPHIHLKLCVGSHVWMPVTRSFINFLDIDRQNIAYASALAGLCYWFVRIFSAAWLDCGGSRRTSGWKAHSMRHVWARYTWAICSSRFHREAGRLVDR